MLGRFVFRYAPMRHSQVFPPQVVKLSAVKNYTISFFADFTTVYAKTALLQRNAVYAVILGRKIKKVPSALLQMALGNTVNYARLRRGTDTVWVDYIILPYIRQPL